MQARVYSNKENPLSAGAVAIADRNALLDPRNLLACLKPSAEAGEAGIQSFAIEPCSASYTLTRDDNEFYILYAGTTQEICQAFWPNGRMHGALTNRMKGADDERQNCNR